MNKKIMFINLPSPSMITPKWSIPNSLLYLKSYLEKKEIYADILDMAEFQEEEYECIPLNYDYYCITCYTIQHVILKEVCNYVKKNANAIVVVGGRHVTYLSEDILKEMEVDVVIRGEGEETIYEVVSGKALSDILGISYKEDGRVFVNEDRPLINDINKLPYPKFDCLNLRDYPGNYIKKSHSEYRVGVMFSRGCYGKCEFCTSLNFWKGKVRFHDFAWIEEYISYLVSKKIYDLHINDDNFFIHPEFEKICMLLKEKKIRFQCLGASINVNRQRAEILREAGCYKVSLGIESGSNRMLKMMNKFATVEVNERATNILKDVGLYVESFLIIGFPGESRQDIYETIEYIKRSRSDIFSISTFVPFPGTNIWNYPEKYGIKLDKKESFSKYLHLGKTINVDSVVMDNDEIAIRRELLHNALKEKDVIYAKINGQN